MSRERVIKVRRRILIAAHAISPNYGSEPGMGWNIVHRLGLHHQAVVLCSPIQYDFYGFLKNWNCREDIESFAAERGLPDGLEFVFVEPPLLSRLLQRESFSRASDLLLRGLCGLATCGFSGCHCATPSMPFRFGASTELHRLSRAGLHVAPGVPLRLGASHRQPVNSLEVLRAIQFQGSPVLCRKKCYQPSSNVEESKASQSR